MKEIFRDAFDRFTMAVLVLLIIAIIVGLFLSAIYFTVKVSIIYGVLLLLLEIFIICLVFAWADKY